jgi:hypothetical protein
LVAVAPRGRIEDVIRVRDGSYLAVGSIDWNAAIWRSSDGVTWSEVTDVPPVAAEDAKGLNGVIQTADGYLGWGGLGARGSEGGRSIIWTSVDGTHWEEAAILNGFLLDVAAGGPGYVGVGSKAGLDALNGALAWSSIDGSAWIDSPGVPGGGNTAMFDAIPFDGGLLAVGGSRDEFGHVDGRVWRSDDGIAWGEVSGDSVLAGDGLYGVIVSDGRLIASSSTRLSTVIGELDKPSIWVSGDGSSWTQAYGRDCCGWMLDVVDEGGHLFAMYYWYVPEGKSGVALLRSDSGDHWMEIGTPVLDADIQWTRLMFVEGGLGLIGLGFRKFGNDEFQPVLLMPPAAL